MKRKITDTLAARSRPAKDQRQLLIRDTELTGFGLRLGQTGSSYFYEVKRGGKTKRVTIGDVEAWSADDAREQARTLRREVDVRGEVVTAGKTLADVWAEYYIHEWPALSATMKNDRDRHWRRHIEPTLGTKRLNAIVRADCVKLHRGIKKPVEANRTIETLRRVFNYAIIDLEWFSGRNPAQNIKKNPERKREDYFTPDEIASILELLPANASGDLIRILIFTGCRPAEAYGMAWLQVDVERRTWTKQADETKQRKVHRVPLNDAAVEVISRQPKRGPLVFTRENGEPVKKVDKTWKNALRDAEVGHHRLYDCRHSLASLLASNGVSLQTVGAVLGHSNPATTARYAHLYDDTVRDAVNVVQFPARTQHKVSEAG